MQVWLDVFLCWTRTCVCVDVMVMSSAYAITCTDVLQCKC